MSTPAVAHEPIPAALLQIRDLVYETAGIFQSDTKLRLLQQPCECRMQALGVSNLREYYLCLTALPIQKAELVSLLNEITIGETSFFRNRPQFDALWKVVLPRIAEAKAKLNIPLIRIWSAGYSTGEEPYTLAIALLEEALGLLKGLEIRGPCHRHQRTLHCDSSGGSVWRVQPAQHRTLFSAKVFHRDWRQTHNHSAVESGGSLQPPESLRRCPEGIDQSDGPYFLLQRSYLF